MPTPQGSPAIYSEAYDVDLQLRQRLGLPRAPFVQAVLSGDLERRSTTGDDAPGADGYYLWTRTLRTLRIGTRGEGWHNELYRRIPATFNNDESIAIAVSSGDDKTGRLGDDPATKNIKGGATISVVEHNKLPYGRDSSDEQGVDFWYLLVDANDQGVWAEVSRPNYVDPEGYVSGWTVRIILGEIVPDAGPRRKKPPIDKAPSSLPTTEIVVPIRRKSA